jgi:hypothetical protein
MGNNNSVHQNLSNEEIMANINKLFVSYQQADDSKTIQSLDMSNFDGGCVGCKRNRYELYENKLGGSVQSSRKDVMLNNAANIACQFSGIKGGSGPKEILEDLQFDDGVSNTARGDSDMTSNMFMSEIGRLDNLSATSLENNSQTGGNFNTATSNMFMSEIGRLGNLSATSHENNSQTGGNFNTAISDAFASELRHIGNLSATSEENFAQAGGRGCNKASVPCANQETSSQLGSLSEMTKVGNSIGQNGGCSACSSTSASIGGGLFGGKYQTSEEINIMPFYSSTSGTEYYSNMQKSHRYT